MPMSELRWRPPASRNVVRFLPPTLATYVSIRADPLSSSWSGLKHINAGLSNSESIILICEINQTRSNVNRTRRLSGFALTIVNRFPYADPDIEQSDAGDDAAHEAQAQKAPEVRGIGKQRIIAPDRSPGHGHQYNSNLNAEDNEDDEEDALHPDGQSFGRGTNRLRVGRTDLYCTGSGDVHWRRRNRSFRLASVGCRA